MMNSEQVISLYETVSDITARMLVAAQSRDWENLVGLESDCASTIQVLKEGEPPAPLSGQSRTRKIAIIHKIMAHDREIRNLTEPWMAELAALMHNAGTERKLSRAYDAQRPA